MLEELKSEDIVNKVGGRFKLVALMQKRLQELLEGSRPLIDAMSVKLAIFVRLSEARLATIHRVRRNRCSLSLLPSVHVQALICST